MHSLANPIPTSRRLGLSSSSKHCKLLGLNNSFPCRRSRTPSAAETLGPSVDNLHNVQRLSLTQSLELDGAAPEGHPDSTVFSNGAGTVPASRTRAQAAAAAASAIAASNGSSNGTSSIRRLRSSSRTRAAAAGSSSSSSSVAAAAAAALAAEASMHEQQQHHQQIQQDPGSSSSSAQQQHLASSPDAAAEHASPPTSSSSGGSVRVAVSPLSSDSEDEADEASDKELQSEFHDSNCCQDILDIVADELPRFAPHHTVTALNRLAKLARGMPWEARREVLAESSFVKLLEKLQGQVDAGRLNAFQLSTSLYSCAALQVPLVALSSSSSSSSSSSGISRLLPALESAMQSRLADFNDRDVSSALYAYAQLKVRRPSSLAVAEQLCKQAQSLTDRQQMGGQSLSMCLWAVATLHTAQQQQRGGGGSSSKAELTAFRAAAASLVASAVRQLRDASFDFDALGSQGVANSIWAAAKLELHDTALLKKGCEWVAANAGRCKVQEVMNVLWAAGVGHYRPVVLQKLTKHIASQAQALKPADVASLFHVLGLFGFDLAGQLQQQQQAALLARAQQLLPQMKPSEAASLYWGMGMARFVHCELFVELTETLGKLAQQQLAAQAALEQQGVDWQQQQQRQRPGQQQQQQGDGQVRQLQDQARQLPDSLQRQAFQAFIASRIEEAEGVSFQPEVLVAFKSAWEAGLAGSSSSSSSSGGNRRQRRQQQQQRQQPLLQDLDWMLQQLSIKAAVGRRSRDGLLHVDLDLQASGQRRVALQLLEPHSCSSDGQKLAPAQWEEDVLLRNGFDAVVWWQVAEWKACPKAARLRLFAEVLRRAGVNPQERLVAAAEKAWQAGRMDKGSGRGGSRGAVQQQGGDGLGMVGASGIRASEADLLMQDRGGAVGGWASGGRGTRSRARSSGGSSRRR
uniref:RAP domain-containing protein n=1 Tax=Tetradesmus obliquus TaxID=3088 RepID=A0A383VFE3_TETOB|eukprot:jgi/Sobl393_1/16520/SZX63901.1